MKIIEPQLDPLLPQYAEDYRFQGFISKLKHKANPKGNTIWMINSTAAGGGVAEMLPTLISILNELGYKTKWAVIEANQNFFQLTKRIHNLIHDASDDRHFTAEHKILYEKENQANYEILKNQIHKDDIVIIHDPQPLPLGSFLSPRKLFWRCHIGFPHQTASTTAVWDFMRPYFKPYTKTIFSLPEYIPNFLNSTTIAPAIDPLSNKNISLSPQQLADIMCASGLQFICRASPIQPFQHQVQQVYRNGLPGPTIHLPLLFHPYILQISRWDKLKGWLPLLRGYAEKPQPAQLILAGPDPASIADDPEGKFVLNQIITEYMNLPQQIAQNINILLLPMRSLKENALIVNALQSKALFVIQNSIQEGFGLTVTEAMWKAKPILGTRAAGLQAQVKNSCGLLTADPNNHHEISNNIEIMFKSNLNKMGKASQKTVYENFLIFRQVHDYINLLEQS